MMGRKTDCELAKAGGEAYGLAFAMAFADEARGWLVGGRKLAEVLAGAYSRLEACGLPKPEGFEPFGAAPPRGVGGGEVCSAMGYSLSRDGCSFSVSFPGKGVTLMTAAPSGEAAGDCPPRLARRLMRGKAWKAMSSLARSLAKVSAEAM